MQGSRSRLGTSRAWVAAALLQLAFGQASSADTLYVPAEYPTIQGAIAAAAPDDTVRVAAGIYPENVTVNKRITLDGAGASTVIRPLSGNGIVISASGGGSNSPLIIRDLTVADCAATGIRIAATANYLSLANVTVSNCAAHGMEIFTTGSVNGLEMSNCAFVGMTASSGLRVRGSLRSLMAIDCLFSGNQIGLQSIKANADGTIFSGAHFERCTFAENTLKGAYLEKLANARFERCEFSANGTVAPEPAGIEFQMRYGTYSNISLVAPLVVDCGLGDPAAGAGIVARARNDGAYVFSPAALRDLSIRDACILRCPFGISIGNNVLEATVAGSTIAGNFVVGLLNWTDAGAVTATSNYWGDDAGPSSPEQDPAASLFVGYGDREYGLPGGSLTIDPALGKPPHTNVLYLLPNNASVFIRPGENILAEMNVANLTTNVNACQAMLGYSSSFFEDPSAGAVTAGGGIWDFLIWDSWLDTNGIPGEIDAAIGIDAQGAVGSRADATVARIALDSRDDVEGVTHLLFRPDPPDDPGAVRTTLLADIAGNTIHPAKVDSATIYVDGTPPLLDDSGIVAIQDQSPSGFVDVKDCANLVLDGTVLFAVESSDALAGLDGAPAITLTNGTDTATATYLNETPYGVFNYSWDITPATPGGPWRATVTATDKSGNDTSRYLDLCLRTFSVTGLVELEGFRGTATAHSRTVTFAATGGAQTKIWTQSLTNVTGATFAFALDDVPAATTHLSAKTNWNLRRRVPVTFDPNGIAAANLTGTTKLPAGDISGDNRVTASDYIIFRNAWFTANTQADLNGDGTAQTLDYVLLRANWFAAGDAQ